MIQRPAANLWKIWRNFSSAIYKSPNSVDAIFPPEQQKAAEKSRIPTAPSPKEDVFNGYIPMEQLKVSYGNVNEGKRTSQVKFFLLKFPFWPISGLIISNVICLACSFVSVQ